MFNKRVHLLVKRILIYYHSYISNKERQSADVFRLRIRKAMRMSTKLFWFKVMKIEVFLLCTLISSVVNTIPNFLLHK